MAKFEYTEKEIIYLESYLDKLNEWGQEGWELLSKESVIKNVYPSAHDQIQIIREVRNYKCLLKREIL
jgi:hypothetical protein